MVQWPWPILEVEADAVREKRVLAFDTYLSARAGTDPLHVHVSEWSTTRADRILDIL